MVIRGAIYVAITVAAFLLAYYTPIAYLYSDYKDYLTLLSGVSGMVFTIMGIWIAFLYPNALSRLVNPAKIATADFSDSLDDTRRLESIVAAVLKSALVMTAALIITILKLFISKTPLYADNILLIKSFALAAVATLTIMQIESVFNVAISNVQFINDLHKKRQDRKSEEEL